MSNAQYSYRRDYDYGNIRYRLMYNDRDLLFGEPLDYTCTPILRQNFNMKREEILYFETEEEVEKAVEWLNSVLLAQKLIL